MPMLRPDLDRLQAEFSRGRPAQAIAACEALIRAQPSDMAALRLLAIMLTATGRYTEAALNYALLLKHTPDDKDACFNQALCFQQLGSMVDAASGYQRYTERFPQEWDGHVALGYCCLMLGQFDSAIEAARAGLQLNPGAVEAWTIQGKCHAAQGANELALDCFNRSNAIEKSTDALIGAGNALSRLGRPGEALVAFDDALNLSPQSATARLARAEISLQLERSEAAIEDLEAVLRIDPNSEIALKRLSTLFVRLNRARDALTLCERALQANPKNFTARLGRDWILSELVPVWHVPMMNEHQRNKAYHEGLAGATLTTDTLVFEIGTGSGLLSMMAAQLGAGSVVTCEAVSLVAETAREVVAQNGYADRVHVIAKPSQQISMGAELPRLADVLVHEIFSSELLGEHVLSALEDAKARLLKPGAKILPARAHVMVALVAGSDIAGNTRIESAHGFDLSAFNRIQPRRKPLYREDLSPILLSDAIPVFSFDFEHQSSFPPEVRESPITASADGRCLGLIQWIRLDFSPTVHYENHPLDRRTISGWQHIFYGFDQAPDVRVGQTVRIKASHDRSHLWFDFLGVEDRS